LAAVVLAIGVGGLLLFRRADGARPSGPAAAVPARTPLESGNMAPSEKALSDSPEAESPPEPDEPSTSPSPSDRDQAAGRALQAGRQTDSGRATPVRGTGRPRASAGQGQAVAPGRNDPAQRAEARAAYQRGNARLLSGDLDGAIQAYGEAVRLNPTDPAGYRGLGLAHAEKGNKANAIRHFRQYLRLAPNAPDAPLITRRMNLLGRTP
jgi:tetratricopeptide (TPR) repeat protein